MLAMQLYYILLLGNMLQLCGNLFFVCPDDLNLAYHSVLPLEVHGANYSQMRLLNKQVTVPQTVSS